LYNQKVYVIFIKEGINLKIKKRLFILGLLSLLVFSLNSVAMANDNVPNYDIATAKKADAIVNYGRLSDDKAILKADDGAEYEVNLYEITRQDETTSTGYIKEYAVVLDTDNIRGSGSTSSYEWDDSVTVKGTVTINYNKSGNDYLITNFSGSWTNNDYPNTQISNFKANCACFDGTMWPRQIKNKSFSTSSFNYSTGFTNYAYKYDSLACIAANSLVTITRPASGHSWQLIVNCTIADNYGFTIS
jgi:lipopolysaccharide export LptBFGC system permease protein LptF